MPVALDGVTIIIDIDRMEETADERGWSRWRPNPATGLLSNLVEQLVRKWQAIVVYGLDWERGTEEAVLEIPSVAGDEVAGDLARLARELCHAGVTVTIVAVTGPVLGKPARSRREAYGGSRSRARRLLEAYKRRGGGFVVVDGVVVERLFPGECRVGHG